MTTETPDPRPTSMEELGFRPRGPVHWFNPSVLARAGGQVVLSATFGDYLDKRELQGAIDCEILDHSQHDDCWIDVICDTGDGFDPTYTVAWCAAQRELRPDDPDGSDGPSLPRASLLILGGDEVYPIASTEDYEDRFVGPFSAALPWTDGDDPVLLAIPGNHDWYDGLTSFMRIFGQGRCFGGRSTRQTRSYFAAELPHGHWLWGIDVQDGSYVDVAQIEYFETAAAKTKPGDRLILFAAEPTWTDEQEDAYDNIAWVERKLVPDHVETVLMISGDLHHYAHYASASGGRAKVTAGGGGAFLYPTRHLPHAVSVPVPREQRTEEFALTPTEAGADDGAAPTGIYPTARTSTRMSWRVLGLGYHNPWFMLIPAIVHTLLFLANSSALRDESQPFSEAAPTWSLLDLGTGAFRSPFTNMLVLLMVLLLALFYDMPKDAAPWKVRIVRPVVGVAHTAVWLLVNGLIAFIGIGLFGGIDGWARAVVAAFVFVVGGLLGSVVFGCYLWLAFLLRRRHDNEVFSAFRSEDYKNFLRLHVTAAGVTVYPIGIEHCHHDWAVDPDNPDLEASHVRPAGGSIATRLIEEPYLITGDRPRPTAAT